MCGVSVDDHDYRVNTHTTVLTTIFQICQHQPKVCKETYRECCIHYRLDVIPLTNQTVSTANSKRFLNVNTSAYSFSRSISTKHVCA